MDRWKIIVPSLHMDWNRDVNREWKSPFVEPVFHLSASETVTRSDLNISMWKMSSCVDFKNVFDFWLTCGVQSTYCLTQFVALMVQTPICWQMFRLYLSQKAHLPAQSYPCV